MTLLNVYSRNGHNQGLDTPAVHFNDMMSELFGSYPNRYENYSSPKVNISEDKEYYTLSMAAPGLDKKNIKINLEKDSLTISYKMEDKSEDLNFTRREFNFNQFERTFYLPEFIDFEKIISKYENGILSVTLPKRDEAIDKGPREISIS